MCSLCGPARRWVLHLLMLEAPRSDLWQVGIVPETISRLSPERLLALRGQIQWLPCADPWRYLADPFAVRRGSTLHVFVESFDYRDKRGVIERHDFDLAHQSWSGGETVLARPFHLSYPQVFEHHGMHLMLPESAQAGELALYRSNDGLRDWRRECRLLEGPVVDGSLFHHDGRWWLFHALLGRGARDQRELHLASAPSLAGPWTRVGDGPLHVDPSGARPAGRPWVDAQGDVVLPVQDCSRTYGGAVRLLRVLGLGSAHCRVAPLAQRFTGDQASDTHCEGLHTLSACGEYTLIDVKRIERSRMRQWLDLKRRARRWLAPFRSARPASAAPNRIAPTAT